MATARNNLNQISKAHLRCRAWTPRTATPHNVPGTISPGRRRAAAGAPRPRCRDGRCRGCLEFAAAAAFQSSPDVLRRPVRIRHAASSRRSAQVVVEPRAFNPTKTATANSTMPITAGMAARLW